MPVFSYQYAVAGSHIGRKLSDMNPRKRRLQERVTIDRSLAKGFCITVWSRSSGSRLHFLGIFPFVSVLSNKTDQLAQTRHHHITQNQEKWHAVNFPGASSFNPPPPNSSFSRPPISFSFRTPNSLQFSFPYQNG